MLTDAKIRKIKPTEKRTKYADEKGMYLEVLPSGGIDNQTNHATFP